MDNGVATYTLPDLVGGQTYYIAVTACITFTPSDESDYSNEVIGGIFVVATSPAVGGSVSKSPDKATYVYGDQVQLTAVANPGYTFSGWSGDASGTTNPVTVTMDGNKTVTASFTQDQYSLTVSPSPAVGGSVSKNPDKATYVYGDQVQLTAVANPGYTFSGWSGDASGATITMDANKKVIGIFTPVPVTEPPPGPVNGLYTVTTSPSGRQITIDGTNYTAPQIFNWSIGSIHTISTSSPQSGAAGTQYVFSHWSDGGAQDYTITAPSANTTYTANFTTQYSLTIAVSPSGGGTVNPAGTNWYNGGQSVPISAKAGSGYTFSGWSGDLTGSTNPAPLTMSSLMSITAQFTAIPETLSTPAAPIGPSNGNVGIFYSYIASGASSNLGHSSLEYQFDWGDGTLSAWSSSTTASKTWSSGGSYAVKVQARCGVHTNVVSAWSIGTPVIIQVDSQITCTDGGIQCLERTDGGHDGDNLVNGRPKVDVEYQFKIVMQDKGGTPEYVKLFMTQRSDPRESDFYGYDMSCSGDYATGANCTYRTKLGPAPVHKIFFQAKTSGETIITYPDSGYITGPQIHLLRGYNLVGIPRDINNALFDGQEALGSPEVYRWQADEGYYTEVTTSQPVMAGEGYLVYADTASLNELPDFEEVQAPEYSYFLKPGLNCISNPYSGNVKLSNVKIQKGTQTPVSWQEAASNGVVVDALYYYNGEDWGDTYSHMTAEGGAALVPWLGYWMDLNSTDDVYFLVISKP